MRLDHRGNRFSAGKPGLAVLILLLPAAAVAATQAGQTNEIAAQQIESGAYLAAAAGCVSCHTDSDNDGPPFAGGHALESPYGTFYAPNITPDEATGIGGWTDRQFVDAVKRGQAPDGSHYYPAFPYPSYAGMSDTDVLAVKAFLDSLAPVTQANRDNELRWYVPGRWAMAIWKWLFSPWQYPGTNEDDRGAYLVRHLGHCGECHTPRNFAGALRTADELQGSPEDAAGRSAPAIDGASLSTAGWSRSDLEFFLEIGMLPDGDFAGGSMAAVIDDNTSRLSAQDRASIAAFLLGLGDPADERPDSR